MAATGSEFVKLQQLKTAMDSKQPDMTGVVKYNGAIFSTSDGENIDCISLVDDTTMDQVIAYATSSGSSIIVGSETLAEIYVQDADASHKVSINATPSSSSFSIDSKSVTSITDDASTGDTNALATAKAVKDYVTSLIATDEEFDTYMGLR